MNKNVASQSLAVFAFDITTGAAKTGDAAQIAVYVSKDWGAVTQLADTTAAELDSTNAPGWYLFAVAQAETNADALLFTGKSSTGNVSVVGQLIYTLPASFSSSVAQTGDSFARLGAPAGASVSADIAAVKSDTAAILVDTGTTLDGRIPAALVSGRMDSSVGAMAANVITAAATAADFSTEVNAAVVALLPAALVSGRIDASVGAMAANVLTATAINADAITAAKIADGAIDAATFAASAINAAALAADAVAEIADGVWDEDATGHQTGGTFGQAIGDPGADTTTIYQSVVTDAAGTNIAADIIAVKSDTAAILVDTGTTLDGRLPAALVGGRMDSSVGAMAANTLTASALAADAVDEILDDTVGDGTITVRQALRVLIAGMAGKLSGAATTTVTIRNLADSADVVVATVDANGNRTATTVTP